MDGDPCAGHRGDSVDRSLSWSQQLMRRGRRSRCGPRCGGVILSRRTGGDHRRGRAGSRDILRTLAWAFRE
jgi:hypothetical protein